MKKTLLFITTSLLFFGCASLHTTKYTQHNRLGIKSIDYALGGMCGLKFQEANLHDQWLNFFKDSANKTDYNNYVKNGTASLATSATTYAEFLTKSAKLYNKYQKLIGALNKKKLKQQSKGSAAKLPQLSMIASPAQKVSDTIADRLRDNKELLTGQSVTADNKDAKNVTKIIKDSLKTLTSKTTKTKKDSADIKRLAADTVWLAQVKDVIYPDSIAPNKFALTVAAYTNITNVPDNDSPGLTQYYGYISIPLKQSAGLPNPYGHSAWFRNIYLQPTFNVSSANTTLPLIDSIKSNPGQHYANKLDILQYAYIKTPVDLNVYTYINHTGNTDYLHIYLDLMGGLLFTKDTIKSKSSGLIKSSMWGVHVSARTESGVSKKFTFELGGQLFGIQTDPNNFLPDLNLQYPEYKNYTLPQNALKQATINNLLELYYNLDFIASFNTNIGTIGATAFFHLDYYSNLAYTFFQHNSYCQIQLGTVVDITSIFPGAKSGSSSSTKKGSTGN